MQYYLAQGIGLVAFAGAVFSFQKNSQKGILTFQLVSSSLFCLHFALLGAYVGALLNAIAALRAFVFSQKDKNWAKSRFWLGFFTVLCVAAGLATWENWFSLLPIVGMVFTTVAFWIHDPALVRMVSFPSSPCWLIYNAVHRSWAGVMTESFVITSILVAMWRYEWSPAARARKRAHAQPLKEKQP